MVETFSVHDIMTFPLLIKQIIWACRKRNKIQGWNLLFQDLTFPLLKHIILAHHSRNLFILGSDISLIKTRNMSPLQAKTFEG